MKDARTAQQNYDYWIAQAERYERFAALCINPAGTDYWQARAAGIRANAAKYLTQPCKA